MRGKITTLLFLLLLICVFFHPLYRGFSRQRSRLFLLSRLSKAAEGRDNAPFYRETFVEDELAPSQHCASMVELGNGNMLAAWYGGSNEGEPDVAIYQAEWDKRTGNWSPPRVVTNRTQTQAELGCYIKKIGNSVLLKGTDGRIWLFYVTVSMGGWSGSALNYKISCDEGRHWSTARRLITSPLLNMGTLVKGAPLLYSDGTVGLPTYHEMFCKFGELVHLDPDGAILDKSRVSSGCNAMQPFVIPLDSHRALAFMRKCDGGYIDCSSTSDGGSNWSESWQLALPNPDAPVAGLNTGDATIWLVFNNTKVYRDTMALARSTNDGITWEEVHIFEDTSGRGEEFNGVSYPYIVELEGGVFHLLYTWDRARIKHISFNRSWLEDL